MRRSTTARSLQRRPMLRRRAGSLLATIGLSVVGIAGFAAAPAGAVTSCDPGSDVCVVQPDVLQTPVGIVTVTVGESNVVTVQLAPASPNSLMFGIPFAIPPGPPAKAASNGLPAYARTSLDTPAGLVVVDTVVFPVSRFALPNLAIVSIHPPGPCKARTDGMTVVFTPLFPPGPPT